MTRSRINRRAFLGSLSNMALAALPSQMASASSPILRRPQAGITTERQTYLQAIGFDVNTDDPHQLAVLLKRLSHQASELNEPNTPNNQHGSTITIGFGPTLFGHPTNYRFNLRRQVPEQLHPLPAFAGDNLDPQSSAGDILVQICSNSFPELATNTTLIKNLLHTVTRVRWSHSGYVDRSSAPIPRNPIGFEDGILNPSGDSLLEYVFTGDESPRWMQGGTYLTLRRISIDVTRWNLLTEADQEQLIGRRKSNGAPLGEANAHDPLDLNRKNKQGEYVIPLHSHVRGASPTVSGSRPILRRSYNYHTDFTDQTDIGILFFGFQRNIESAFQKLFPSLVGSDILTNSFTTHTASSVFAIPPSSDGDDHWIGESLFS